MPSLSNDDVDVEARLPKDKMAWLFFINTALDMGMEEGLLIKKSNSTTHWRETLTWSWEMDSIFITWVKINLNHHVAAWGTTMMNDRKKSIHISIHESGMDSQVYKTSFNIKTIDFDEHFHNLIKMTIWQRKKIIKIYSQGDRTIMKNSLYGSI